MLELFFKISIKANQDQSRFAQFNQLRDSDIMLYILIALYFLPG
jgi:hypothetical protein